MKVIHLTIINSTLANHLQKQRNLHKQTYSDYKQTKQHQLCISESRSGESPRRTPASASRRWSTAIHA